MDTILKSLSFNVQIFVAQIVMFIALWIVLSHLFWNPMLKHLRERGQRIDDAHQSVEAMRHEMETLRADYQTRIAQVEAEARSHIQAAVKEAQTERERLLSEARAQTDATLRQNTADGEREKTEALTMLQGRMTDMALAAVGKALGPTSDPTTLRRFLEEQIVKSAKRGPGPARY